MSTLRPVLRHSNSSPAASTSDNNQHPGNSISPSPSFNTTHRVSVQLPPSHSSSSLYKTNSRSGTESTLYLPSAMHHPSGTGTGNAISPGLPGSGAGFPRTRTNSSGHVGNDGKYRRKVGFEAFEAGPAALFAFTCQAKSEGYKRSRNTRVFAVAVSPDESGETALEWLMTELVEDGDEVVAIRVIELDEGERHSSKSQDEFREEAQALLQTVLQKNNDAENRRISVIVEFVAGEITETLLKMIALYRPDSLVVGTKGQRSRLQSWGMALGAPGMGSVSRFCVSHSPIPVIVVRPERKVKKHLEKRQNDPKRGQYAAIVGPDGLALSRSRSRERSIGGGISE